MFYLYFINFWLCISDKREFTLDIISTNENLHILDNTNKENLTNNDNDVRIVDSQGIHYIIYMCLNAIVF